MTTESWKVVFGEIGLPQQWTRLGKILEARFCIVRAHALVNISISDQVIDRDALDARQRRGNGSLHLFMIILDCTFRNLNKKSSIFFNYLTNFKFNNRLFA